MDIWRELQNGGESGAQRLVSEYGDRLLSAAMLLCRDKGDAEDLVFRTLDRAIRKIGTYRPTGSFFAWLYAILLNFHRMDARRRRPEPMPEAMARGDLPAPSDGAEDWSPSAAADRAAVREAVLRLPPALRETVVLRLFGGLSTEDVARACGVPPGTVKSRLFHAKEALRAALLGNADPDTGKGTTA